MQVNYTQLTDKIGFNYVDSRPLYLLDSVFVIAQDEDGRYRFKIHKGFKSDGCTIPKIFWSIIGCPHTNKYIPASIVHDFILQNPKVVNFNRKKSSEILYRLLINEGVSKFKARLFYYIVEIHQAVNNPKTKRWH